MSSSRLRVLVIASTFPRWQGDSEPPFVYNLAAGLTEKFDVTVLAPHGPRCKTSEQWDELQVVRFRYFWPERFERLAYGGILPNLKRNRLLWLLVPFFILAELFATLRLARSGRFDVLHAHWVIPQGLVATLVGWITHTPVLTTCHAGDIYALRGWLQNRLKRWSLNRCSYVTTVSNDLMKAARAMGVDQQERSAVISMGVDTTTFHPGRRDETLRDRLGTRGPLVLFVGRLAEKKGVRYLLEAMPKVIQKFPDTTLIIVGDGPLRGELEGLSQKLGIETHVQFVGAVPSFDLPPYYATADVFVAPSITAKSGDTEGLPTTIIEAMASGCPVVSSDVGGVSDIIVQGQTGILAHERDCTAIAEAICNVLGNETLRISLVDSAIREVRARFDQKVITDMYAAVILQASAGSA